MSFFKMLKSTEIIKYEGAPDEVKILVRKVRRILRDRGIIEGESRVKGYFVSLFIFALFLRDGKIVVLVNRWGMIEFSVFMERDYNGLEGFSVDVFEVDEEDMGSLLRDAIEKSRSEWRCPGPIPSVC